MEHFYRNHPLADMWKIKCNPYLLCYIRNSKFVYSFLNSVSFIYFHIPYIYIVFIITYLILHKINMVKLALSNNFIQNSCHNIFSKCNSYLNINRVILTLKNHFTHIYIIKYINIWNVGKYTTYIFLIVKNNKCFTLLHKI